MAVCVMINCCASVCSSLIVDVEKPVEDEVGVQLYVEWSAGVVVVDCGQQ